MEPHVLTAADWAQLSRVLESLLLMVAFAVAGATAMLIALAILPSLAASDDVPASALRLWRRVLLPAGWLALALTVVAFLRVLLVGVPVLQQIYPRWLI